MPRNSTGSFSEENKKTYPVKWLSKPLLILLVFITPLIFLVIVVYPLILTSGPKKFTEHYRLSSGFTKVDVDTVVAKMREDMEYQIYFKMLLPGSINRATDAAYQILDRSRNQQKHFEELSLLKQKIQSASVAFNDLDYPKDFSANPMVYPDMIKKLWGFIEGELQLTILGICYKSTYDQNFQFGWDEATKEAAQKATRTIFSLTFEQRKEIDHILEEISRKINNERERP